MPGSLRFAALVLELVACQLCTVLQPFTVTSKWLRSLCASMSMPSRAEKVLFCDMHPSTWQGNRWAQVARPAC
jgi:hypothetical protein